MRFSVLAATGAALLRFSSVAAATEWKWVGGLDCVQIKLNRKGLRDATVTIYQASAEENNA